MAEYTVKELLSNHSDEFRYKVLLDAVEYIYNEEKTDKRDKITWYSNPFNWADYNTHERYMEILAPYHEWYAIAIFSVMRMLLHVDYLSTHDWYQYGEDNCVVNINDVLEEITDYDIKVTTATYREDKSILFPELSRHTYTISDIYKRIHKHLNKIS